MSVLRTGVTGRMSLGAFSASCAPCAEPRDVLPIAHSGGASSLLDVPLDETNLAAPTARAEGRGVNKH